MGAMSLGISELCLSFSPYPNFSDGNFYLIHHFCACKYSRQMKKGSVELGEEGESESKVMNKIFGRLQHPKNDVRYMGSIFFYT